MTYEPKQYTKAELVNREVRKLTAALTNATTPKQARAIREEIARVRALLLEPDK